MNTLKFKIINITCGACVKLSNNALKKIPGVIEIKIDEGTGQSEISSDQPITFEQVQSTLRGVGKTALSI